MGSLVTVLSCRRTALMSRWPLSPRILSTCFSDLYGLGFWSYLCCSCARFVPLPEVPPCGFQLRRIVIGVLLGVCVVGVDSRVYLSLIAPYGGDHGA